jgi:HEAT repeat protein
VAPNAQVAQEPALLLSYVEDPIAVPYLSQLLDAHKLVEKIAVSGLERIGDEESVKILILALSSGYGDTSDLALQALKRTLRKSSDPVVKRTIRDAGIN